MPHRRLYLPVEEHTWYFAPAMVQLLCTGGNPVPVQPERQDEVFAENPSKYATLLWLVAIIPLESSKLHERCVLGEDLSGGEIEGIVDACMYSKKARSEITAVVGYL
jgi:hypothetical protein